MTSFLRSNPGPFPFTGGDICAELGISGEYLERLIESVAIAPICLYQHARVETWAITTGPRFDEESTIAVRKPTPVGPEYQLNGIAVRDCVYEPAPWMIARARKAVISWCLRADDPALADAIFEAENKRRAQTTAVLRQELIESLAGKTEPSTQLVAMRGEMVA